MFSNFFFLENRATYEIMRKKCCITGQVIDDNMAHAPCVLGTYGYKHKLRICNNAVPL
jgi:hypothetical protein